MAKGTITIEDKMILRNGILVAGARFSYDTTPKKITEKEYGESIAIQTLHNIMLFLDSELNKDITNLETGGDGNG